MDPINAIILSFPSYYISVPLTRLLTVLLYTSQKKFGQTADMYEKKKKALRVHVVCVDL